ncbi:NAD+ synthase [Methanoculleus sp. FWC-SCC1]|uniref:Glutamine-dependent NAD(+) synthetase n=1 Tax=Methanoculleus frigidifontis TaxID=2584085 RepID=A0ABT8M6Y9_9EURY|nr:NAD+ synthase [Methanoculleus sp. FWC-SCC1]MDN7023690.1 NAD+ synthase [Methanoculleus sp. FWC-SCC1]
MRLALLQLNTTVADLDGNAAKIAAAVRSAAVNAPDLIVTPELALAGYPPRDLLLMNLFVGRCREVLDGLARDLAGAPPVLVGFPERNPESAGRPLYNAAALLHGGRVVQTFRKTLLPTYDVFDEDRYFEPAAGDAQVLHLGGHSIGISICEDIWNDRDFWSRRRYRIDPIAELVRAGAEVIVNISASPFTAGKQALRERMLGEMARKYGAPLAYVNQVGGNDDLVFAGRSSVFDAAGTLIARGAGFTEDLVCVDLDRPGSASVAADDFIPESEIWRALVLGTRDYVRKTGFSSVLLGLSGGIDSAVVAAVAAEAVGAERVLGVLMPSPYSSAGSVNDAQILAGNLGIRTIVLPIRGAMDAFDDILQEVFAGLSPDITEENMQARIRAVILMALSNKLGSLLLSTGNKSELSVGYSTIYGDMAGGLAVIADVPKGMVYRLARWLNRNGVVIPEEIITKPPSAELRPDQTDQDTLPPYEVLDAILYRHIDLHESAAEIVAAGFPAGEVERVLRMVRNAEFKRKQAPPGLKVTDRAFGTGWGMPIARGEW